MLMMRARLSKYEDAVYKIRVCKQKKRSSVGKGGLRCPESEEEIGVFGFGLVEEGVEFGADFGVYEKTNNPHEGDGPALHVDQEVAVQIAALA